MKNKILTGLLCLSLVAVGSVVAYKVHAESSNISVLGTSSFSLLDTNEGNVEMTLPSLSGLNGQSYVIKQTGSNYAVISPASGEKLEGQVDLQWYLGASHAGEYLTLVADETNETWWIVGEGYTGY